MRSLWSTTARGREDSVFPGNPPSSGRTEEEAKDKYLEIWPLVADAAHCRRGALAGGVHILRLDPDVNGPMPP